MFVPTEKLQDRIAQSLHDDWCYYAYCTGKFATCAPKKWNRRAIAMIAAIMPTLSGEMFPAVREDERQRIVDRMGRIPLGFMGCPGGHECACGGEVLDTAFRAVEGDPYASDPVTPS